MEIKSRLTGDKQYRRDRLAVNIYGILDILRVLDRTNAINVHVDLVSKV